MPHHGAGWSAAFLAAVLAVLGALASANAPVLTWEPVEDLMAQVYEYRTDRQILIETGTPKNGRYNGAKLNGRGYHAAVSTCESQVERLRDKFDEVPSEILPTCYPLRSRWLRAACGTLATKARAGDTTISLLVNGNGDTMKAGVLLPCDGFSSAEGKRLAIRDDVSVSAAATDSVVVSSVGSAANQVVTVTLATALTHDHEPLESCVCEAQPAPALTSKRCKVLGTVWGWRAPPNPKPPASPPPAARSPRPWTPHPGYRPRLRFGCTKYS